MRSVATPTPTVTVSQVRAARGWRTPVQGDGKGFPDNVLVRERVIFVELKRVGGKLSPDQRDWMDWLTQSGQECYVWTIDDMEDAVEVLRRRGQSSDRNDS